MEKYEKIETGIEGLYVIKPTVHGDDRGFFMESYTKRDFENLGITQEFVQDNHSKSSKGVLRGMHYQINFPQTKLVRVVRGAVYDAVVDLRKDSKTYGKYFGVELSEDNHLEFLVPKGFAHGFLVLSDEAEFLYKVDDFYHPGDEGGLPYNDEYVGIDWPLDRIGGEENLNILERDRNWPNFMEQNIKFDIK